MTQIKICGLTTLEDALFAAQAGADLLGINFYPQSPRYISPQDACALTAALREELGAACPVLVGIFVNRTASDVLRDMDLAGVDFAQLSGDESVDGMVALGGIAYKGLRPRDKAEALDDAQYYLARPPTDERIPALLVDAYHKDLFGGTGEEASAEIIAALKDIEPRLMLAGGLTPENVAERVRQFQPWGVDVASGVEGDEPGRKDRDKVRAFIEAVRQVDAA